VRAIYNFLNCRGAIVDSVTIDLPAEFTDADDFDAESFVLRHSKYADEPCCSGCGGSSVTVRFAGYPIMPTFSKITVEGLNREVMIDELARIIRDLREMPKDVSFVESDGYGGRIG
jgi:hypothetical protein